MPARVTLPSPTLFVHFITEHHTQSAVSVRAGQSADSKQPRDSRPKRHARFAAPMAFAFRASLCWLKDGQPEEPCMETEVSHMARQLVR